jgi:hypothetical protein
MNKQLSIEDLQKYQNLLARQFNEVGRSLVLTNKETWALFLEQEESEIIPRDHLPALKSILLGSPNIPIEVFRDIATEVLKKHKFCTIIRVLHKMTNGNLMPELVNHSLKMTSQVLIPEV